MKDTIAIHFVAAALRGAKARGHDLDAILAQAGISPALLRAPKARVTPRQYTALMQALWLTMQDECVGLTDARSKLGTFAMMCHAIIHAATLQQAMQRGTRFYNLVLDAFTLSITRQGDRAVISLQENPSLKDPDHFLAECFLVIWHGLACWLTGRRIRLLEATFSYGPPRHAGEYPAMFSSELLFNQPVTSISFHALHLASPVVQDEKTLKTFLRDSPADLLVKPRNDDSLSAKIRRMLRETEKTGAAPSLSTAAARLHVAPQTLRRRLKNEGTSYQALKDDRRRDAAISCLARADLSIDEIAGKLGFSEPSAFHRAFKKWTGSTPGAYRRAERFCQSQRANRSLPS